MNKTAVMALILISISLVDRAHGQMKYTRLTYGETYDEVPHSFLKASAGKVKGRSPGKIVESAKKLHRNSNFKEAVSEYLAALAATPPLPVTFKSYMGLGQCFREMKEYDRSIKCFTNAEGLLSKNRGELFSSDDEEWGSFQVNLASIYSEISISYLGWNKYASAIVYLWQSRRSGGDAYSLGDSKRLVPLTDPGQKKLVDYPLYKFLARETQVPDVKSVKKRYFRKMNEGDPEFKTFRAGARPNTLFFVKPVPDSEIKEPAEKGKIYQVYYDSSGAIVRVTYNDHEESSYAPDFDRSLYYRGGRPVSSLLESHTYNYVYYKIEYNGNGKIKYLCFITIPTQVGHHGFIPGIELFIFE